MDNWHDLLLVISLMIRRSVHILVITLSLFAFACPLMAEEKQFGIGFTGVGGANIFLHYRLNPDNMISARVFAFGERVENSDQSTGFNANNLLLDFRHYYSSEAARWFYLFRTDIWVNYSTFSNADVQRESAQTALVFGGGFGFEHQFNQDFSALAQTSIGTSFLLGEAGIGLHGPNVMMLLNYYW